VSGAAIRFDGQVATFDLRATQSPCYACLFPPGDGEDELCSVMGVFAPVTGIIGTVQAAEALKLVAGLDDGLAGRLLILDALAMRWHDVRVPRDPQCPVCAGR
jgi:adenylyltransferase/sulfurtransferase